MRLKEIKELLRNSRVYGNIQKGVSEKRYPIGVYGLSDSSRALLISSLMEDSENCIFVISDSDLNASSLYEDLLLYELNVYFLPSREIVFYNADAISGDLKWERLKVIREMIRPGRKIIVTSAEALGSNYMPKSFYERYSFSFRKGDVLNLKELGRKLVEMGYERVEVTENRGQFSLRGGILDVYSPTEPFPVRIELFGDEIDTLRTFNPETQRSLDNIETTEIFPSKEIIVDKDSLLRARDLIRKDLEEVTSNKGLRKELGRDGFEKLKGIVSRNIESLEENWTFETIDSYLPYFFERMESIFDYVGNSMIIIDEPSRTFGKVESLIKEFNEKFEIYLKRGDILPRQGKIIETMEYILGKLKASQVFFLSELKKTEKYLPPKTMATFDTMNIYSYHGQLPMLVEEVKRRKDEGYRTLILSATRPRGERLMDTLREEGVESIYRDVVGEIPEGGAVITFGSQKKGFAIKDIKFALISDSDVFGEANTVRKHKRKKVSGKGIEKIKSFDDLRKGEYVVHVNHGIGVYMGIKQLEVRDTTKDYIEIAFDRNDKIYLPVDQLDLIQKYIGSEGNAPKVSKLGSPEWAKLKSKAKEGVDKIAKEIVELYAKRSRTKGFMFSEDTDLQKEFEDEFPYDETEDQLASIREIKKDMESDKVMDRLLCGDVGFGKTEVAIRAAFKAILDNKQVAVLVPTTILAEQHFKNFKRRFEGFGVNVEMVSRFRTLKEARETIKRAREGNVDILVGTHMILSDKVKFKDLGLLIVDEEQRFGVRHKEKLKELKTSVDVLTLSATPIPRTLNLSMTGIRDISLIETPPEDRFPIQTYVLESNDQLIRDAVLRELSRHGQVYYVFNRVAEIEHMASYLKKLIPEAEFGIAHGQLTERELEQVMVDFMEGEFDVLVCSTIIETGLDIENVNTIIIHDADKFGLSQLYQLRGRVGRSNKIAYAYLTYRRDKVLTEIAEKRLKALKDFTELGAGFKIAMRDLEIRGAGNMMGKAQHGHMAQVGYDMYIRMLDEAVKRLMGTEEEYTQDTLIDIKIDAFIPFTYIKDEVVKIQIYKKIADIEGLEDYLEVKEELEDRFGLIPKEVYNLMDIAELKFKAKKCGVTEIREQPKEALISFVDRKTITDGYIGVFIGEYKNRVTILPEDRKSPGTAKIAFKFLSDKETLIKDLKKFFDKLKETEKS